MWQSNLVVVFMWGNENIRGVFKSAPGKWLFRKSNVFPSSERGEELGRSYSPSRDGFRGPVVEKPGENGVCQRLWCMKSRQRQVMSSFTYCSAGFRFYSKTMKNHKVFHWLPWLGHIRLLQNEIKDGIRDAVDGGENLWDSKKSFLWMFISMFF